MDNWFLFDFYKVWWIRPSRKKKEQDRPTNVNGVKTSGVLYTPKSLLRYVHSIDFKFDNKYSPKHDFVDTLHIDNKNSTLFIY